MELMCETCGLKMTGDGMIFATLLGYMPQNGHDHDDNCLFQTYSCPNKHYLKVSKRRYCNIEGCNWAGKEECFCHPGKKFDEWPE